jgi:AraC-like DNA-binding protein
VQHAPEEALVAFGEARAKDRSAEAVCLYRPEYLPGVELWSIRASSRPWIMLYEFYAFCGPDEGSPSWRSVDHVTVGNGRSLRMQAGDLMVAAPGDVSRIAQLSAPLYFHAINVQPHAATAWLAGSAGLGFGRIVQPQLMDSFQRAWRAVESVALDVTEREHHLRSFLAGAFPLLAGKDQPRPGARSGAVKRAREFIDDLHAQSITLSDIAQAAGASVWHLERSFSAALGVPLHTYLQHVRLARAMAMLRRGARSAEASQAAGFADQSHMTRAFRRWLGITPRTFQRAVMPSRARGESP